jgi:hypothetical protein
MQATATGRAQLINADFKAQVFERAHDDLSLDFSQQSHSVSELLLGGMVPRSQQRLPLSPETEDQVLVAGLSVA